jgi:large conductance mechanosensitive channel
MNSHIVQEFKDFVVKGNAFGIAVGVVIGAAFNGVVNSLVKDIILGFVANVASQPDFNSLAWGAVRWGSFLNSLVNLLIISLSLFVAIKAVNKLTGSNIAQTDSVQK